MKVNLPYLDAPENAKKIKISLSDSVEILEDNKEPPVAPGAPAVDDDNLCVICKVPYASASDRFNLAMHAEAGCVKHDFCKRCLFRMLAAEKGPDGLKLKCPICRALPDPEDTVERARGIRACKMLADLGVTRDAGEDTWLFNVCPSENQCALLGVDTWLNDVAVLLKEPEGLKYIGTGWDSCGAWANVLCRIEKEVREIVSCRESLTKDQYLCQVTPLLDEHASSYSFSGIRRPSVVLCVADGTVNKYGKGRVVDRSIVHLLDRLNDISHLIGRLRDMQDRFITHINFAIFPCSKNALVHRTLYEWLSDRHPLLRTLNYGDFEIKALCALYLITRLRELTDVILEAPLPLPDDLRAKLGV